MAESVCLILLLGLSLAAADFAKYQEYITQQANNETFVSLFEAHLKQFEDTNPLKSGDEFHCKPFPRLSANPPQSVHQLTPMDIKVIASLGDSITAGTGILAKTVISLLKQDRGKSWSVGGDNSVPGTETLANIMKVYNPKISGYSKGWGPVWLKSVSQFNVADPGDKSEDMPGQAVELVKRMQADKTIDYHNDWKIITLFIGGNDLCSYCEDKEKYSPKAYISHIEKALDYIHEHVPRVFVNLVEILDISIVKTLNANLVCNVLHYFLCDCAAFPKNAAAEQELITATEQYRIQMNNLVRSGKYDTRDDFTVVVQPFFSHTQPPMKEGSDEPDLSYFAPDCFHLSLKGHRAAADALWNNMIEPVGQKRTTWQPSEVVECPSAKQPYFYTYKNSGSDVNDASYQGSKSDMGAELQNGADPQTDDNTGSTSPTVTVLAVVASVALVTMVVVFVVLRRRNRQSHSVNRDVIVWPRKKTGYTEI